MSILKLVRDNTGNSIESLQQKITYIKRADETSLWTLYGANVSVFNTYNEMMLVKYAYGQIDGRAYNHIIFNPENGNDISEENMYYMGMCMAGFIGSFHGYYQVLAAVHHGDGDGEGKHLHFIANNIDFMNGSRLDLNKKKLIELKVGFSQIAAYYGIEPIRMYRPSSKQSCQNDY